jgi:hypothetical protein
MKSRVVVWVIVGLVVVAGIIFLLVTPRGPRVRVDEKTVEAQLVKSEGKLAKLEEEIAQVKSALPQGSPMEAEFGELDKLVSEAHAKVNEVKAAEGVKASYAKLREAQQTISDARRQFRKLAKKAPKVQTL